MLENDLILQKFFHEYQSSFTYKEKSGLVLLLGLNDNDLLDLFLKRSELTGSIDTPNVRDILEKIRNL